MSETAVQPDEITCPRCGYDLRGTVSTWTDQCPIQGTCTECGLVFQWTHVLMISKYEPRWCVEFTPSFWRVPRASVGTILRSMLPWMFWRKMHMSSRVRWGRLAVFLFLLVLLPSLLYVPLQATRAILVRYELDQMLVEWMKSAPAQIANSEAELAEIKAGAPIDRYWGSTREELIASLEAGLVQMKASLANPPSINFSYFSAIFEALTEPFGRTSSGTISQLGMTSPYPAPAEYQQLLTWRGGPPTAFGPAYVFDINWLKSITTNLGLGFALALLLPITFILLPASRRKAKVQWRHIGRIAIYSFSFVSIITTLLVLGIGMTLIPQTSDWTPDLTWQLPWLLWLLVPVWWWVAIKRYLHMPHAAAVAFLMTVMIGLLFMPLWLHDMPAWLERLVV